MYFCVPLARTPSTFTFIYPTLNVRSSRNFLRNVGIVSALPLATTTQKTISTKHVSSLIFGSLRTNSLKLTATKQFETSHLINSHFTICCPCVVTHNIQVNWLNWSYHMDVGSQVNALHFVKSLYTLTHILPSSVGVFRRPLTAHFCNIYIKSSVCPPPISFF